MLRIFPYVLINWSIDLMYELLGLPVSLRVNIYRRVHDKVTSAIFVS